VEEVIIEIKLLSGVGSWEKSWVPLVFILIGNPFLFFVCVDNLEG